VDILIALTGRDEFVKIFEEQRNCAFFPQDM
jgi:hypothetical protein